MTSLELIQLASVIIQALSALTVAAATIALVCVTRAYVRLTGSLAEAARYQMEAHRSLQRARRSELQALTLSLLHQLSGLPRDVGMDVRDGTVGSATDFAQLRQLASEVGLAISAAYAERQSEWLRDRLDDVRREPGATFDWKTWRETIDRTKGSLHDVFVGLQVRENVVADEEKTSKTTV